VDILVVVSRGATMSKIECATGSNRSAAILLAAIVGVLTFAAFANEEAAVPPPPASAIPNSVDKVTLSALDENYIFDANGRRDPFTFTKAVVDMSQLNGSQDSINTEKDPGILPKDVVEKKRNAAELACNLAEASLMELDPNASVARCDQGMEEFKDIAPNDMGKYPELEVVKNRILRARKAADQMRNRQTAERDFSAMNIKIAGVMAQKKNSQAIINSKIVHKGDLVAISSDSADVMVDEILPERVVFVFRGYRMTLLLSEAGR
jgi:hypothetical protein